MSSSRASNPPPFVRDFFEIFGDLEGKRAIAPNTTIYIHTQTLNLGVVREAHNGTETLSHRGAIAHRKIRPPHATPEQ